MRPVNRTSAHLDWLPLSLAEILRAAGCFVETTDTTTAREHEKLLEDQFPNNRLCRFALAREVEAVDPWVFSASDPVDAEQAHIFRSLCICVSVICVFAFVWCSSRPTLFENPLLVSARLFGTLSERLASPR